VASSTDTASVKVMVRVRPFLGVEKPKSCVTVLKNGLHSNAIRLGDDAHFTFDRVFEADESQEAIFVAAGKPIAESALQGFNGSIFAYGQTGSGKTHTMQGLASDGRGLIPRVLEQCFAGLNQLRLEGATAVASCSYVEIYNELVYDLLDNPGREKVNAPGYSVPAKHIRENSTQGVFVEGLVQNPVQNMHEAMAYIKEGSSMRHVASTQMNRESSRSHSIFTLALEIRIPGNEANDGMETMRTARINLVDLAGSERQRATGTVGERLTEAKHINKSLSALGNVISALVDIAEGKGRSFVPHRDSVLTYLLRDSLGGNTKTSIIATVSPDIGNAQDTLSTLKFGQRAKNIRNVVKMNTVISSDVNVLQKQVKQLREQLEIFRNNKSPPCDSTPEPKPASLEDNAQFKEVEKRVLEATDLTDTPGQNVLRARITHLERVLGEVLSEVSEEREIGNNLKMENMRRKELEEVLKDTISAKEMVQELTAETIKTLEQGLHLPPDRQTLLTHAMDATRELGLRAEIAQLKAENAALSSLYKEKRDSDILNRRVVSQQTMLEAVQEDKAELERIVKDLSQDNKQQKHEISRLEKEAVEAKQSSEQTAIIALQEEKEVLETELKVALARVDRLDQELFITTEQYSSRPSLLQPSEAELQTSSTKIELLVRQRLVNNLCDAKKRISLAENETRRLSVQLDRQVDSARKQRKSLRQSLSAEKSAIDLEQLRVVQLQLQLEDSREKYDRVIINNQHLKEAVESTNTLLAIAKKEISDLKTARKEKKAVTKLFMSKENFAKNANRDSVATEVGCTFDDISVYSDDNITPRHGDRSSASSVASSVSGIGAMRSMSVAEFFPSCGSAATTAAKQKAKLQLDESPARIKRSASISTPASKSLSKTKTPGSFRISNLLKFASKNKD